MTVDLGQVGLNDCQLYTVLPNINDNLALAYRFFRIHRINHNLSTAVHTASLNQADTLHTSSLSLNVVFCLSLLLVLECISALGFSFYRTVKHSSSGLHGERMIRHPLASIRLEARSGRRSSFQLVGQRMRVLIVLLHSLYNRI
jgi:hypothetical protein